MTTDPTHRRSFLASLAAIPAAVAGLFGARAKADEPKVTPTPEPQPLMVGPCDAERRIRAEIDRVRECILDPAISPERRAQFYAAQQALAWAIDPDGFMGPSEAVHRNLCFWPDWDSKPVGADEFAQA